MNREVSGSRGDGGRVSAVRPHRSRAATTSGGQRLGGAARVVWRRLPVARRACWTPALDTLDPAAPARLAAAGAAGRPWPSVAAGLPELNGRLVRRLIDQMMQSGRPGAAASSHRPPADLDRRELVRGLVVAVRNCCELGQGSLATEAYRTFRATRVAPMTPAVAAQLLGAMTDRYRFVTTVAPVEQISAAAESRRAVPVHLAFSIVEVEETPCPPPLSIVERGSLVLLHLP